MTQRRQRADFVSTLTVQEIVLVSGNMIVRRAVGHFDLLLHLGHIVRCSARRAIAILVLDVSKRIGRLHLLGVLEMDRISVQSDALVAGDAVLVARLPLLFEGSIHVSDKELSCLVPVPQI